MYFRGKSRIFIIHLPIYPLSKWSKDQKAIIKTSEVLPLTSSSLFSVNSAMWHLMTPSYSLTALWGCGRDVSAGIVANAGDWAGLLQERQLIKPGSQPSRVWQISIYHQHKGARVKLETLPLLTPAANSISCKLISVLVLLLVLHPHPPFSNTLDTLPRLLSLTNCISWKKKKGSSCTSNETLLGKSRASSNVL